MPIVPDFHGGVPQVQDNGHRTLGAVTPVTPPLNYEKTLEVAMKPVHEYVHNLGKVAEIEVARDLKAETDEADSAIVGAIQKAMYDPETGYMSQNGKAAVDGYKPFKENLNKEVTAIVDRLSPVARENLRARVADRLQSADAQAMRWNRIQSDEYHVQSSKSHVEVLRQDASQHYAEPEYLAKTMGSIEEEVRYQASHFGWDEETTRLQIEAHRDALQASRFQAWAEDDPLGAFAEFESEKDGISPEVRRSLDTALWHTARDLLATQLANQNPIIGNTDALYFAKGKKMTGIPLIDNLSPARKAELFTRVWGSQSKTRGAYRSELETGVKNSLARIEDTGNDPEMISEDWFVAGYGEKEGKKRYNDYVNDAAVLSDIHNFDSMSLEQQNEVLEATKPVPGAPDYADWKDRYEKGVKARDRIAKERTTDPVKYAIEHQSYGFKPLAFPTTPDERVDQGEMIAQISTRVENMGDMAKSYGLKEKKVFTKDEARQMERYLGAMSVDDRSAFIDRLTGTVDAGAVSVIRKQMGKYEMPFLLSADPEMNEEDASRLYMLGKSGFEEKQFKVTNITSSSGIGMKIEKINGLYQNEAVRERVIDAWKNVAGGLIVDGQESGYGRALDHALKIVVGDIHDYNGRKIALRGGASLSSVDETVRRLSDDYRKTPDKKVAMLPNGRAYTGAEFANELKTMPLTPAGDNNTFFMVKNDMIVRDMEGNPLVLTVPRY